MKHLLLSTLLITSSLFAEDYKVASETQIEKRVEKAQKHLSSTEGGKLLWESIEAHGGLDQWFKNGLLEFRWTYHMTDRGAVVDSTQTIDTWSSRARHIGHGSLEGITFGWDGTKGWQDPADAKLMPPADFWSLTPYYFVGVPHVLADPGTIHEKLAEQIQFEGKKYDQVKVTYKAGTGATPDDYYIALIDPETKLIKGVRYIVTDQRITGGKPASPEKLLTYEGWEKVNGVLFPKSHDSYKMNNDTVGEKFRSATVSEAKFTGSGEISFNKK